MRKEKMRGKKKKKWILPVLVILGIIMIGTNNDETQVEQIQETSQETETGAYGWTTSDYEEFNVALKMISDNYLNDYKIPLYNKWQFAKLDDEGRIFAMTDELTFKNDHEKHLLICVFSLSGNIGSNGLHEEAICHYFSTDEKIYYDDGTCDEVFEKLEKLVK